MASSYQSLLDTPKPTKSSTKKIWLLFPIVAVAFSAAFLVLELFKFSTSPHVSSPLSHLCKHSQDPETCLTLISETFPDGFSHSDDTIAVLQKFLMNYVRRIDHTVLRMKSVKRHIKLRVRDDPSVDSSGAIHQIEGALADCLELMELSIGRVHDSVIGLANLTSLSFGNAEAWLSAVLTNHVTCLDGLQEMSKRLIGKAMEDLNARGKASLAILAAVSASNDIIIEPQSLNFPSWITSRDRKLLESSVKDMEANVVVAQDGTGDYKTVTEAVAAAPDKSKARYVIYVKKGTYKENVEVTKKKKNLMIIGDGMELTIITGNLSVGDGSTTFKSATLAAVADGFILQDICIQNSAGPGKHQAVALRVGADQSVINRCRIDAYQDTLYAHSLRQFYKDCYVAGTVDFIFGNAAVVFQNSKLIARKPMKNQKNMITAQGRTDPNQNTGTSIQYCNITASPDLEPVKNSFPTFLGRPWKEYSRTMVMETYIGDHIDPAGWAPWNGDFALKTLYYGEYMNRGPGAGTNKRVNWPGFHVVTEPDEAMKFTVAELIQGGEWLRSSGVEFIEGL